MNLKCKILKTLDSIDLPFLKPRFLYSVGVPPRVNGKLTTAESIRPLDYDVL